MFAIPYDRTPRPINAIRSDMNPLTMASDTSTLVRCRNLKICSHNTANCSQKRSSEAHFHDYYHLFFRSASIHSHSHQLTGAHHLCLCLQTEQAMAAVDNGARQAKSTNSSGSTFALDEEMCGNLVSSPPLHYCSQTSTHSSFMRQLIPNPT